MIVTVKYVSKFIACDVYNYIQYVSQAHSRWMDNNDHLPSAYTTMPRRKPFSNKQKKQQLQQKRQRKRDRGGVRNLSLL